MSSVAAIPVFALAHFISTKYFPKTPMPTHRLRSSLATQAQHKLNREDKKISACDITGSNCKGSQVIALTTHHKASSGAVFV